MLDLQDFTGPALAEAGQARLSRFTNSRNNDPQAAREAARAFEGQVIGQLLAPMFETLSTDGRFGGGEAERIWRQHLVDEIGNKIANAGGIGIADHVYPSLLRLQEA